MARPSDVKTKVETKVETRVEADVQTVAERGVGTDV